MPDLTDVKVGDTLWVEHLGYGPAPPVGEVDVTKVGRRWVTTDYYGMRFDRSDGTGDCNGPGGMIQAWKSREQYLAGTGRIKAWWCLRSEMRRDDEPPAGVTYERIQQARELLGLVTED